MTFNNFNISESNIGVINTGEVERIDLAMGSLQKDGATELVEALGDFTQTILNIDQMPPADKNELLEQVAEVSEQIALPSDRRKKGIVRALVDRIKNTATTFADIAAVWSKLQPIIESIL